MLRARKRKGTDRVEVGPEDREWAPPKVGPDEPAVLAIRSALVDGLHWLRVNEPAARQGDARGVHQLRTTTRRLRTALDLFEGLIEPHGVDPLAADLKWLAGLLGEVRDLDVLAHRFRSAAEESGWGEALGPLFDALGVRHAAASEALQEALRGERYAGIVARIDGSLGEVPLVDAATEPCRTALPVLVLGVWKRLRRVGRGLRPDDPDDDFHEVRKWAKRARYAAEAVTDALDPGPAADAERFAHRARAVQDVLGAHQDAVIAAAEVRKSADAHPELGPFNFAAGQLLERERSAAAVARDDSLDVWDGLDRKKVVRWLRS